MKNDIGIENGICIETLKKLEREVKIMGLFDNKSTIMGTALGVSGAFDRSRKTDTAAAFGTALGASIASGQQWTLEDSIRLGAAISALDATKETSSGHLHSGSYCSSTEECGSSDHGSSNNEFDDLILTSEQEEQLEEAGIDSTDFEFMDDNEKMEALEDAGLDPFDFDMF